MLREYKNAPRPTATDSVDSLLNEVLLLLRERSIRDVILDFDNDDLGSGSPTTTPPPRKQKRKKKKKKG